MPAANQLTKTYNLKLAIALRIEGSSGRSLLIRIVAITTTLIASAVKIAMLLSSLTW